MTIAVFYLLNIIQSKILSDNMGRGEKRGKQTSSTQGE